MDTLEQQIDILLEYLPEKTPRVKFYEKFLEGFHLKFLACVDTCCDYFLNINIPHLFKNRSKK